MAALTLGATPAIAAAARPDITRRPVLTGTAQVGQRLEARDARWTGGSSTTASYAWVRCDSATSWGGCAVIGGATGTAYTLTAADQGKRIRVWLTVRNSDGRDDEVSDPTAAVAAAPAPAPTPTPTPTPTPPPTPTPTPAPEPPATVTPAPAAPDSNPAPAGKVRGNQLRTMRPFPLVRIRGWLTSGGAMIQALTVRGQRGLSISVRCHGSGCPRRHLARSTKVTRVKAFEGFLPAGVRLEIRVTRPGFVGKHTLIRIRSGKAPIRRDRCLFPGSGRPRACPSK